jgi:hypothetical protein
MAKAGVYAIVNLVTGCAYVAATADMDRRWEMQRAQLQQGRHPNAALQRDWNQLGARAFRFVVLERVERAEHLRAAEQRHLANLGSLVYNGQAPAC